ncbi:uncharacterized protein LOC110860436 [Folsomia candida]|uniref:uncharacterized protein LOC110860436 n=1 Tax=Folsomia candida TaxID=158441 RepID=UPI000B9094BB|nr:uncharacterized protein LOC110860436 [Folsomia candida]
MEMTTSVKHLVTVFFVLLSILFAGIGGQQYFDGSGNTPNSQHVEECSLTNCDSYAKCPHGWMELYTERYTCPGGREKKYCCSAGRTPLCYHTPCAGPSPSCLNGYREWSRGAAQCGRRDEHTLHCCIDGHLPQCFNTTCSPAGDVSNQCPGGYSQVAYWKGAGWECPPHLDMRTCCRSEQNLQNQNPFTQGNNPFQNNQPNYDRNYQNSYPNQNNNYNQQQNYQGGSDFRSESCQYTNCETYSPRCPGTHSYELSTDKSYCTQGRERKLCCRPGQLPPCYDTSCQSATNLRCPTGYREWSRDTGACRGSGNEQRLHCCADGQLPTCYNTTCADNPTCATGFLEGNIPSSGQNECDWRMSRKTCCRQGNNDFQFGGRRDGLSTRDQQQSRGTPEGCLFSDCQQYPRCPLSYREMFTDRKTCASGRERMMCCRQDLLPECIDTLCESTYEVRCPNGYREQSRGNQGCSSSLDTKLYCCSDSRQLGHCYNTTCTNSGEAECRRGYVMIARGKGVEWGCPWTAYKSTCCETASWNGGRGNFYHNIGQIIVVSFLVSFLRAYVSV